ncbi:MAG: energy transducer TonB [Vicinamibacterales bacterium]
MNEGLRLSDVLGRTLAVEWFEGVAVARTVAEIVAVEYGGTSVPDLNQVQIAPDGQIFTSGAVETREPVRRLGQLLQAVLTQSEAPVQLRLIVAQATAPDPAFSSSKEFADALGYFERPDRAGVLRRLYARAASSAIGAGDVSPTIEMIAPLQPEEPSPSPNVRPAGITSRRSATVIIGVIVFLVSVAISYCSFGRVRGSDVAAAAVRASDVVGGAVVSGVSKVSESVGLGRLASADPSGSIPPASPPAAVQPVTPNVGRKVVPVIRSGAPDPLILFDLDGAQGSSPSSGVEPVDMRPASPATPAGSIAAPDADPVIYSAADAGVEPPIGLRPQLPRALPADIDKAQLGQIELLILPDGTVGSVKLLGPHPGVIEGMLLSAAKAWTFQPAMKNGRPVSYRKRVWLVLP